MQSRQPPQADDVAIDLGVIIAALWQAKRWIIPLVGVVAAVSFLGLSTVAPLYRSEAKLLIEPRQISLRPDDRQPEQERALLDQEGVSSQVQLITSRDLGRRVIAAEKLGEAAEIGGMSNGLLSAVLRIVGLGRAQTQSSTEERWLDAYFERLRAYAVDKSRVIQIDFSSEDPDLSARVANAVLREYLALQAEAKRKTSNDATIWLESEIESLRKKVFEAEAKVDSYRTGNELFVATNNNTLFQQQLGELNSQLTNARAQKSDAEAKAVQLKRILDEGGQIETASEILVQPLFQRLREREVALRNRIAELSAVYLANHPQIQTLNSQIRDIDAQIRTEARKILAALQNDVRVADQRIRELRSQFNEFKAQAAKANEGDIQLRALEREAKAQRELLESFLVRYREASARANTGAQTADARVISEASPPVKPYFPKVIPLTSVISLAAFLLAVTVVVLRELLSGRALRPDGSGSPDRTPGTARPSAPVPPSTPPDFRRPVETAAILWTRISTAQERGRLVAVTSAEDAATAFSGALALGRSASASVATVCLVALSGAHKEQAALFGTAHTPGVGDLLAGRISFAEAIHRDPHSRLHVLPSGGVTGPVDPGRCRTVLEALAASYDHVIVDAGPIAEADPFLLALVLESNHIVVAGASDHIDPAAAKVVDMLTNHAAERVSFLPAGSAGHRPRGMAA